MSQNATIGIDCRLAGLKNAGIGRHILNLCLRLPFMAPGEWRLVYFLADKAQWAELMSHLSEINLPAGTNAQDYLGRVQTVIAPIKHYTLQEQRQMPAIFAGANLDLLHVPHFNLPYLTKIPRVVVTIHDLLWHEKKGKDVTTLPAWQYYLKYQGYKIITKHAVQSARAIITPSKTIGETVGRFYPQVKNKIRIIYNGVNDFHLDNCPPFYLKVPEQYLLYVGSLYPHKNVGLLLQALAQNRDLKLVIVSARDAFWEQTQAQIKSHQLESQITFLGQVNDCQLSYLYAHAQALIQPSLSEGFGLTGIEAMRAGCLVMASDIPIFQEIYGRNFVKFDPLDVNSFLQSVQDLRRWRTPEIIAANRQLAAGYTWERMTEHTIQVYQEVLGSSAAQNT